MPAKGNRTALRTTLTLRLLSPTDSVKDRLAGYIHWKSRANFDQALLICRRQQGRVDLQSVRAWCEAEGGLAAFEELSRQLSEAESAGL